MCRISHSQTIHAEYKYENNEEYNEKLTLWRKEFCEAFTKLSTVYLIEYKDEVVF